MLFMTGTFVKSEEIHVKEIMTLLPVAWQAAIWNSFPIFQMAIHVMNMTYRMIWLEDAPLDTAISYMLLHL